MGAVAYELELPPSLAIHPVFHVSLLCPYDASSDDPVIVEGQPEFEVESILRHHCCGRGLQCLLHWSGYGLEDATWEPEKNLTHAPAKVSKYWA